MKKTLLVRYSKTTDCYRVEFCSCKIREGETYKQHSIHLSRLFDQWVQSKLSEEGYSSLKDYMILDQFMTSLSTEMRMFIKERNVSILGEAVELSDTWASAHNAYPKATSGTGGRRGSGKPPVPVVSVYNMKGKPSISRHFVGRLVTSDLIVLRTL